MKLKAIDKNFWYRKRKQGFTIIELMISTVIFSLVLIILTFGVISISRSYYKGVTTSQTQNAARNIASTIAQAIEFDGTYTPLTPATPTSPLQGFCVGNQRFSYLLGYQLTGAYSSGAPYTTAHSLVEDTPGTCSSGTAIQPLTNPGSLSSTSTELMGNNMRLANLTITPQGSTGLYTIDVRVVYGSYDLLCNDTADSGSCSSSIAMNQPAYFIGNVQCKGQDGEQFCAASELSSTVARRIE